MEKYTIKNKHARWLLIPGAFLMFGCVNLPAEKEKNIWPWEYGTGQGEPNTGDYTTFRAGVAKFGEPPKAVKPVKPEPDEPHPAHVRPAAEGSPTDAEPPAVSQKGAGRVRKDGYDFTVSEIKSTANLLLDKGSPAYDITASNYGNAPVSVAINIDKDSSHNASADKRLPNYAVVPAHADQTLVRFSAKAKERGFDFRYNSRWSIGDYTATHNCPEQYRFPFGDKVRAFASVSNSVDDTPYTRNAVVFSVPKGTPVLAARKGVVVQIGPDGKVDILHADSTIGTYHHLERIGEYVAVGKSVTTDDVIGVAGTSEDDKDAHMQLAVWRPEPIRSDQLLASSQRTGFEAVSFPLAFTSAGSDKGRVLTKNQPVSRGEFPAPNRPAKRNKGKSQALSH